MNTIRNNKKHFEKLHSVVLVKKENSSRITIVSDEKRTADLMNKFFISIKKSLNLKPSYCKAATDIDSIMKTCKNHISK